VLLEVAKRFGRVRKRWPITHRRAELRGLDLIGLDAEAIAEALVNPLEQL